jgi:hypothetical protein
VPLAGLGGQIDAEHAGSGVEVELEARLDRGAACRGRAVDHELELPRRTRKRLVPDRRQDLGRSILAERPANDRDDVEVASSRLVGAHCVRAACVDADELVGEDRPQALGEVVEVSPLGFHHGHP